MKARQAAYATLNGVINQHRTLNTLIAQHKSHTAPADQAFYQALVYGTLRQYRAYSHLCAQMMTKPPARPGHPLAIILNLGLCQLLTMNLGDHGVINETVNLAAHNGQIRAKGLINAILRRIQREREHWQHALTAAQTHNLPHWLCPHYPAENAAIAAVNTLPPPRPTPTRCIRKPSPCTRAATSHTSPAFATAILAFRMPLPNMPLPYSPRVTANTSLTPALRRVAKPATCSNSRQKRT